MFLFSESALRATNEQGLEQAMDWLINQQEKDEPRMETAPAAAAAAAAAPEDAKMEEETEERSTVELIEDEEPPKAAGGEAEARSLKCEEYGLTEENRPYFPANSDIPSYSLS